MRTALAIRSHLHILPAQVEELAYRLRQQERVQAAMESQVRELRSQVTAYEGAIAAQQASLKPLHDRLQRLKELAGFTPVSGPGVVVELDDSSRPLLRGEDPNEVILHNYDIVQVVNELFAAGAEAVAVNGQRIIATTPIKSVATTLMINAKRTNPPMRIEAIGDSDRLAAHVLRREGYLKELEVYTFPVRVTKARRLVLPAYTGPLQYQFARPVPGR
ncbi:MAG: DUF881 domain-containing protein [Longimicrobiales bacterium]